MWLIVDQEIYCICKPRHLNLPVKKISMLFFLLSHHTSFKLKDSDKIPRDRQKRSETFWQWFWLNAVCFKQIRKGYKWFCLCNVYWELYFTWKHLVFLHFWENVFKVASPNFGPDVYINTLACFLRHLRNKRI